MFTVTRTLEEALLQHFIYQKLEIAYAIHKPFPFFEALRDKSFITERMYRESMEACTNLVPVSKVVHNVLTKLEKTFNLSLLVTLFSQINLREYPNLMEIFRSFKSVGASHGEWRRATPIALEVPADPAEGSSLQPLLALPPSHPPTLPHLAHTPGISEPRASLQQIETLDDLPSPSDPAVPPPGPIQEGRNTPVTDNITPEVHEEEDSREMRSPPPGTAEAYSSDSQIPQIKDEEPQEMPCTPSGPIPVIKDDSPERSDPEEPQEAGSTPPKRKGNKRKRSIWSTPKRRRQKKSCPRGTASPGRGIQEKLPAVDQVTPRKDDPTCNSKVLTRSQKARIQRAQKSRSEETASPGHRIQKKLHVVDQVTQRKHDSTCNSKVATKAPEARTARAQTSRSEENPKEDAVDFLPPTLPVTCGHATGILHKEKMKLGSSEKSIRNEEGAWFTPMQFAREGRGAWQKNWKRSVLCRGKTLGELLEKGFLICPPRTNLKRAGRRR